MIADGTLINKLRSGHKPSFEIIFKQCYPDLFNFAYSYTMDKQTAEDIVQDVFFNLWLKRKSIPIVKNLKAYLYTAVKNRCLDYFKHMQVIDKNKNKLTEAIIFSKTTTYEENSEVLNKVRECIAKLPKRQQEVIELRLAGLKYSEIAANLNISEHSVHSHIKNIYKSLRNNLQMLLFISALFH